MRECDWIFEFVKKILEEDLNITLSKLQGFFDGLSDHYSVIRNRMTLIDKSNKQAQKEFAKNDK